MPCVCTNINIHCYKCQYLIAVFHIHLLNIFVKTFEYAKNGKQRPSLTFLSDDGKKMVENDSLPYSQNIFWFYIICKIMTNILWLQFSILQVACVLWFLHISFLLEILDLQTSASVHLMRLLSMTLCKKFT